MGRTEGNSNRTRYTPAPERVNKNETHGVGSLRSIFLVGSWWIDADSVGQGRVLRRPTDEALGVLLVSAVEDDLALRDELSGLMVMHGGRGEQLQGRMMVVVVVPVKELLAENGGHPGWSQSGPDTPDGTSWF
jgi:hypothetical protein